MSGSPRATLLALIAVAGTACSGGPHIDADRTDQADIPDYEDVSAEFQDDAVDAPTDDGGQADVDVEEDGPEETGDGDSADACPVCGADCGGFMATCGRRCCSPEPYDRDPWPRTCEVDEHVECPYQPCESRLVWCQLWTKVIAEGPAAPPELADWTYRSDGSEAVLFAQWVDGYGADPYAEEPSGPDWYGWCAHHCWDDGPYAFVVDVRTQELLHVEVLPWSWADPRLDGCVFRADCGALSGDAPTIPIPEEDLLLGGSEARGAWFLGWSETGVRLNYEARLHELPTVRGALPYYRLSTGERLGALDVRLLPAVPAEF